MLRSSFVVVLLALCALIAQQASGFRVTKVEQRVETQILVENDDVMVEDRKFSAILSKLRNCIEKRVVITWLCQDPAGEFQTP